MSDLTIRETRAEDIPALQIIVGLTEMFPPASLLPMVRTFLANETSEELWLTGERDGRAIGLCYAAREELTDRTWNMLTLAVHPDEQGTGAGSALVSALEAHLHAKGQRILIVETSGTDDFQATRAFYAKCGYRQEAVIHDFWEDGADKITFWKSIQ